MDAEDLDGLQKPGVDFALTAGLLTFHRIQNRALGIEIDTRFTTLLLKASYQALQDYDKIISQALIKASLLKGTIQGYQERIEMLIENAKTPEEQRVILPEVIDLQEKQQAAMTLLEGLN